MFDIRFLIIEGARNLVQYQTNDQLLYLNGELPKQVFNTLDQLKFLDLNFNKLSGEIPPGVYKAFALEQFDLDFNVSFTFALVEDAVILSLTPQFSLQQLSGEIKPEIGGLTNLTFLQISNNLFSGQLPDTFQGLTKLGKCWDYIVISMSYNNF